MDREVGAMTERNGEAIARPRRIVVGTDFSATATLAVDRASDVAARHDAELIVVHALSPQPIAMGTPGYVMLPPALDSEIRKASMDRLQRIASGIRAKGVNVRVELVTGSAGHAMVDFLEEASVDLAVIGTRGLSGLQHLLLGSTAETVVRRAHCPVLTVHPADDASIVDIRSVLVPCALDENPGPAVDAATVALGLDPAATRLVLLYSDHLPAYLQPLIEDLGIDRIGFEEVAGELHTRLEPTAEGLRERGFPVELQIVEGDPAEVIVDAARRAAIELIVMETRGRTGLVHLFLGSTAERVVQRAHCPVLTIHRPDASGGAGGAH
jgi:nucleotide-binding universal stress UspA family protein